MKSNYCHSKPGHTINLEPTAISQVFNDVYFRIDTHGKILDYQPGGKQKKEVLSAFFLGKQFPGFLPLNVRKRFAEIVAQVLQTQSLISFEYSLKLPVGKAKYEVRILPLPRWQVMVYVCKLDKTNQNIVLEPAITQEKTQQLEKALNELQQHQSQLIQTEKMSSLGQLVAGIAHEINNPINFIYANISHAKQYVQELLGLLEVYEQYYPPLPASQAPTAKVDLAFARQDLPKILDSMNNGAERIRQTVLSLRNFSRVDEEGMKRVNIHEGIESSLQLLQHRLNSQSGHPQIQVIKEYGNLPKVVCDAGKMNQVFMNLLNNAIDALVGLSSDGIITNNPQIFIRTILQDNRVTIRIADNGPGINQEIRDRLFDPFFTTKPVGRGTGLGLSIGYQIIVEKHHGQLECISTPGQGAEFVITIPLCL